MNEMLLISIFVFVMGSAIGSFLNVCIVRMPHEKSVINPPSHCVGCHKPIAWYDNIPFVSYFLLGGKCRYCKAKFSFRYLFIEFLTAIVFVLFFQYYGLNILIIPYLFMMGCFIVATFVDFEHRIIPDEVSVGGMYFGFLFSALLPQMHSVAAHPDIFWYAHVNSLAISIIGALVGGGSLYFMGLLGDLLFKKESMGGGDVKLLAMVGAFLGWEITILTFFIAPLFGSVIGIIEKLRTGDTTIAYGPYLVAGAIIGLFWGDIIIDWVLSGYGLY